MSLLLKPAYIRLSESIEALAEGKGSLGERLEYIRLTILFIGDSSFETEEQKEAYKNILSVYSKHPPKSEYHKPLKSAHWREQQKLAKRIIDLFFNVIETE